MDPVVEDQTVVLLLPNPGLVPSWAVLSRRAMRLLLDQPGPGPGLLGPEVRKSSAIGFAALLLIELMSPMFAVASLVWA